MENRITERDLIIPALYCISRNEPLSTTDLTNCLRDLLKPQGEDIEILSGRSDDKFSQKVRNLRSHKTLERYNLVSYERRGSQGYWRLTQTGQAYLQANQPLLQYLLEQGYDYETRKETLTLVAEPEKQTEWEINLFDETLSFEDAAPVVEGKERIVKQKIYERSLKLRQAAIKHFSKDNRILCAVCGFDFQKVYGEHGTGFIEIHHMKPIFTYGEDDIEKTLQQAISNLVPLCSNCHRMIHRRRDKMLSVEELRSLIKGQC
jgi:5-methylcytosine-specific restriction enzyme A